MSQIDSYDDFSELRAARDALHRHFISISAYDDATIVQKVLPVANRLVTPEESVEAFLLVRSWQHLAVGSNLPHDTDDLVSAQDGATTSVLGELVGSDELGSTEGEFVKQARAFRRTSVQLREEFRHALCLVMNDQNGTAEEVRGFIDAAIDDLVLDSTLKWTGKKRHIETKYCPVSDRAVIGYVLMLLLDESVDLLKHLRVCKLDSCDNYYLAMPGPSGGGQQLYCRDGHRKEAASQTGAERTRKYRKNLKKLQRTARKSK